MDFGCASYCEFAEKCIGNLPPELLAEKEDLLKDRVAIEMKRYFKTDFRRIGHATRVARYAERIGKKEAGNMAVILCAAYLQDIGIPEAVRKNRSGVAQYPEQDGQSVARQILVKLGAKEELIKEVCKMIGRHHHPLETESINVKVLYDADRVTDLEERHKESPMDPIQIQKVIRDSLLTETGKEEARRVLAIPES